MEDEGDTNIDPRLEDSAIMVPSIVTESVLRPGLFVLGTTCEMIALPADIAARIEGKSSLARLGLVIHQTAGYIDAGFMGRITLELMNVASRPIVLYPGMKIGQISFMEMTTPAERPYGTEGPGSKYQGQQGRSYSGYAWFSGEGDPDAQRAWVPVRARFSLSRGETFGVEIRRLRPSGLHRVEHEHSFRKGTETILEHVA